MRMCGCADFFEWGAAGVLQMISHGDTVEGRGNAKRGYKSKLVAKIPEVIFPVNS